VSGSIVAAEGKALLQNVRLQNAWSGESWTTTVDEKGAFSFLSIPAGELRLSAGSREGVLSLDPTPSQETHPRPDVPLPATGDVTDLKIYQMR
jgi:hypothetical protein